MADVFISYASEDRELARLLAEALTAENLTTWWDDVMPAGATWAKVIESEVRTARCVITLWSKHSIESDWVNNETRLGNSEHKLVPAMIDGSSPPLEFQHVQAAPLQGWRGQRDHGGLDLLLASVRSLLGEKGSSPTGGGSESVELGESASPSATDQVPYELAAAPVVAWLSFWIDIQPGGSKRLTLRIRPSLAARGRWSVDYSREDAGGAAYQATIATFPTFERAQVAAQRVEGLLSAQGLGVSVESDHENASRKQIPTPSESEPTIAKRLAQYIDDTFTPFKSFSLAMIFDWRNWPKGLQFLFCHPHSLGLVLLLLLLVPQLFDAIIKAVIPFDRQWGVEAFLSVGPLMMALTVIAGYFRRVRRSLQLDRVREWLVQLVVYFGWTRERIVELIKTELSEREYASFTSWAQKKVRTDRTSLTNLLKNLTHVMSPKGSHESDSSTRGDQTGSGAAQDMIAQLLRDDFARKIQGLVGMTLEPDYDPKRLAVDPLMLSNSLSSVKPSLAGLVAPAQSDVPPFALVERSHASRELGRLRGQLLGACLSILPWLPSAVWCAVISWTVSRILFWFNCVAVLLAVWLLLFRPLATFMTRKSTPRGLAWSELWGALELV